MIQVSRIDSAIGVRIDLGKAPLLLLSAAKGYIMCGYLDISTAEKLGDCACVVRGVKSFEDVLSAKIVSTTQKAKELGIMEGMSGREALRLLST